MLASVYTTVSSKYSWSPRSPEGCKAELKVATVYVAETRAVSHYELVMVNMAADDAQIYCSDRGMNLVVILNEQEHLALQAYIESLAGQSLNHSINSSIAITARCYDMV